MLKSVKFEEYKVLLKKGELDKIKAEELINIVNRMQDKADKERKLVCVNIHNRRANIFSDKDVYEMRWRCLEELCHTNNIAELQKILIEERDQKLAIWY